MALILSTSARWVIVSSGRGDIDRLLADVGLDDAGAEPHLIDADAFYTVVETIVDGVGDLPVRCAQALDIDSYGALGLAFKTSLDLRSALSRVARYGALVSDAIQYQLEEPNEHEATFSISGRPPSRLGAQVKTECALAGVMSFCRQAVDESQRPVPTEATFTHRRSNSAEHLESYFGCRVRFGAEADALRVDDAFLDTPVRLADEGLAAFLTTRLDADLVAANSQHTVESAVRRIVRSELADGVPSMRIVAARLAMSERTLRRRLAAEDMRFDEIVTKVQIEVATALLTNSDRSLIDVAFLTGYADQTAFHRAVKRWTGRTPQQIRRSASDGGRNGHDAGR